MAAGGYDFKFTKPISDKYKCIICQNVLRDATIVSCCSKNFCKSCLDTWCQDKNTCPHCRSTKFVCFIHKTYVQEINEMVIQCSNYGKGCQWQGKLENLETHLDKKCDYVSVSCPNKCKESMLRKELRYHMKTNCLLRQYKCDYCGIQGTYHSLTGVCGGKEHCNMHVNHFDLCEEFLLDCPNNCPQTRIKRKNMTAHREQCPLEPVDCPFKEVGCTSQIVRCDLTAHVDGSDHHHLMLTMTALKDLKMKFQEREATMTTTRQSSSSSYLIQQHRSSQINKQANEEYYFCCYD